VRYLIGCQNFAEQRKIKRVLDDVAIKAQNAELMRTHDSREELHDGDLVLERVLLV